MKLDALTMPVDRASVDAISKSPHPLKALLSGSVKTDELGKQRVPLGVVILVVVGLIAMIFMIASHVLMLQIVAIAMLVGGSVIGVLFVVKSTKKLLSDEVMAAIRLESLAHDNGWTYIASTDDIRQTGALFTAGHNYSFSNVITSPTFQVGECRSKYGSGKNERQYNFAYMAVPLKRHVPNMLLDSKSNNLKIFGTEISNLPVSYDRGQIVSLEGDFDKYYTLYAPEGYDMDVRYIFTPDLMDVLISESISTDMEIVDDTLYVYFGVYNLADPVFWQRVNRIMESIGSKMERQTQYYEDDKTVSGGVANKGRRLKRGVSALAIILIILYIIDFLINLIRTLQH